MVNPHFQILQAENERTIMKIIVIGGSGLIGSKLVKQFGEQGHEAIAASPKSGVNTLTGEGLTEVLKDAQVVVDVSNSPSFEDAAVMEFFKTSTGNRGSGASRCAVHSWVRPTSRERLLPREGGSGEAH